MRRSILPLSIATLLLLAAGCSRDELTDVGPTSLLHLATPTVSVPVRASRATPGSFVPGDGAVDVTGVPSFLPYNLLYPVPINKDYTTIGAFLAEEGTDSYTSAAGYFRYKDANAWETTVGVKPGDFYIFGYMPSNVSGLSAQIEKRTGSWADGCRMVIKDLSTVTPADVCVVVGVYKAPDPDGDASTPMDPATLPSIDNPAVVSQLRQGVYAFEGTEKDNYVYLLLEHLYTNVNLELAVDAEYSKLRTIVLKRVVMKSTLTSTVDATVTLTNDTKKPIEKVTFTKSSDDPNTVNAVLFPEMGQYATPVAVEGHGVTSIPGYFAPGMTVQQFDFEFIYDVYDNHDVTAEHPYGNLVRANCHAINHWSLSGTEVLPGKSFKVTATIRPTYLYQLSNPDLDNPSIELKTMP